MYNDKNYSTPSKLNQKESRIGENYKTLELQGEGSVMVVPDQAVIEVGVETINKQLAIAQRENSVKTNKLIEALLNIGIKEKDIQTISYTVDKKHNYVDGKQIDQGYVVRNILRVTINQINRAGEIVDTAVSNEANIIRNIQFNIEDSSYFYQQALNLALEDAIEKAISVEKQIKVHVNKIPVKIIEEINEVNIRGSYLLREDYTPIEQGQIEINARVKAVFTYK